MKKLAKILITLVLATALLLGVCSCSSGNMSGGVANGGDMGDGGYTGGDKYEESGTANDAANPNENRKIIKNVNESVQTDKYDEFVSTLTETVNSAGGYISTKNENGENYYNSTSLRYCYLVIRIPAEKLDEFTARVDSIAVITSYNESVVDVTAAYIDIESRIAVLEAEESALLDMLTKATTVETALEIRARLLSVQSDLASYRAQLEDYDDRIAYSTVYLRVNEVRRAVESNPGFFEEVGGNFSDSIYNIGQGFRSFGVWLLGDFLYIVIYLAIGAGILFAIKAIRKSRRKGRDGQAPKLSSRNQKSESSTENASAPEAPEASESTAKEHASPEDKTE